MQTKTKTKNQHKTNRKSLLLIPFQFRFPFHSQKWPSLSSQWASWVWKPTTIFSLMTFLGCFWHGWVHPHSFHSLLTEDPETKPFPVISILQKIPCSLSGFPPLVVLCEITYFPVLRCSLYKDRWPPVLPACLWSLLRLCILSYAYAPWPCQVQFGKAGSDVSLPKKVLLKLHNKSWKVLVLVFKSSGSFDPTILSISQLLLLHYLFSVLRKYTWEAKGSFLFLCSTF